jgi:hypothetical protein
VTGFGHGILFGWTKSGPLPFKNPASKITANFQCLIRTAAVKYHNILYPANRFQASPNIVFLILDDEGG